MAIGTVHDQDFYLAKFNTKHNLTEWYVQSDELRNNETVRGAIYSEKVRNHLSSCGDAGKYILE